MQGIFLVSMGEPVQGLTIVDTIAGGQVALVPLPGFIGAEHLSGAICLGDMKFCQQTKFVAVGVTIQAEAALVPAVGQKDFQLVFGLNKLGHIVGLVLNTLSVIRKTGSQHKISDPLSIQTGFI